MYMYIHPLSIMEFFYSLFLNFYISDLTIMQHSFAWDENRHDAICKMINIMILQIAMEGLIKLVYRLCPLLGLPLTAAVEGCFYL